MLDVEGLFHHRSRDADQVAGQHRVLDEVPAVLLPGRHDQRCAGPPRVEQSDEPVGQARRHVQVDEGGAAGHPRVAVGHRDDRALLHAQDVVDVGRVDQRVEQRQLGGAGVAEDLVDAFVAQHGQERVDRFHEANRPTLASTSGL